MTLWLAVGLVGLGLWLAHDGLVSPTRPTRAGRAGLRERVGDWLLQAGLEGVTLPMLVGTSLAGALGGGLVYGHVGPSAMFLAAGVLAALAALVTLQVEAASARRPATYHSSSGSKMS